MTEQSSQSRQNPLDDYSTLSGSQSSQAAYGDYSAVAGPFGTAIVNVYQQALPRQIAPEEIKKALALLESYPTDVIPEVGNLPFGSRMQFARNPLFIGRVEYLLELAKVIKEGDTAILAGIGGIGKTQLAIEFVHLYGQPILSE